MQQYNRLVVAVVRRCRRWRP